MMEINDIGIKCTEDVEEAVREAHASQGETLDQFMMMCEVHGKRFWPFVCEIASRLLTEKLNNDNK